MAGLRVSAGELKGRRLGGPHGEARPTSGKVREALFDIIGGKITECLFLDLYAGTGAIGIEAMSRGAKEVFLVESEKKTASAIEALLKGCGCRARANVLRAKAEVFVKRCLSEGKSFDIVFLDPPYHSEEMERILPLLSDGRLLREGGMVIAEHLSKKRLPDECGSLRLRRSYRYGDTALSLYGKAA